MTETKSIIIKDMRTPKWIRVLLSLTAGFIVPISIGIIVDSSAMQWTGFVFGILLMIGFAAVDGKRTTFKTIAEAKAYLDTLEQGK